MPPGQFFSLTDNLRSARNKLLEGIPALIYEKVLKGTPKEHRELLVSAEDTDLDGNAALQTADRGKLKSSRKALCSIVKHDGWAKMDVVDAVDRVREMTARVLNPASHGSATLLYEEEVRRAMELIAQLEQVLRKHRGDPERRQSFLCSPGVRCDKASAGAGVFDNP